MAKVRLSIDEQVLFDTKEKYPEDFYVNYMTVFQQEKKSKWGYKIIKRLFDFFVSLVSLLILSPLMIIIAIVIKCDSKGPVFFKQKRVGKDFKEFECYKFRSMRIDAPHNCATSNLDNPEQYITKVGRFLRKTSLDELPQLFCCLFGTMSIIGYRPLILAEKNCNDMRNKLGVFSMRPGISGYAQVYGRDDVYYKNKAILDAEYVKKSSIWLDIKLIFQTFLVVLRRDGNADGTGGL